MINTYIQFGRVGRGDRKLDQFNKKNIVVCQQEQVPGIPDHGVFLLMIFGSSFLFLCPPVAHP